MLAEILCATRACRVMVFTAVVSVYNRWNVSEAGLILDEYFGITRHDTGVIAASGKIAVRYG